MRIGVDASCWGNTRGFGRFTRELMKSILKTDRSNDYIFFIDEMTANEVSLPTGVETVSVSTSASQVNVSADSSRSLKDIWAMSREVFRREIDVFFFPAVYSYFPILNRSKVIVTIHDVIADHNPDLIFPNLKAKIAWKLKQKAAVSRADLFLTVSNHSRSEISNYFRIPQEKIRVVSEGTDPVFQEMTLDTDMAKSLARFGLSADSKFLLSVGGISPHKNLDSLISAFDHLQKGNPKLKLVLVGDYKDDPFYSAYPALKKQIAELGLEERVVFTGFVADKDLAILYNTAALLVFPSLEEGFGLPAIEAMSCGLPVAASSRGSLPEVVGNAGMFFDPLDIEEMAKIIETVLRNPEQRRKMAAEGKRRAALYSWDRAARETIDVFSELADESPVGIALHAARK